MKVIKRKTDENIFPYIAYIPENVSEKPALMIHLHGAAERGNGGNELEKVLVYGFPNVVNDENLIDCIMVMPQCPKGSFWSARVESIKRFIDEMISLYHVDTDRVYLCGISMGGFGTWYTAMAYPDLFAAIVPCCGGGIAWLSDVLTMPIWTFHGLEDKIVSPNQTIEMVERIKKFNPNLKYELFEGVGHHSWEKGFTPEVLHWLLSQKKSAK